MPEARWFARKLGVKTGFRRHKSSRSKSLIETLSSDMGFRIINHQLFQSSAGLLDSGTAKIVASCHAVGIVR